MSRENKKQDKAFEVVLCVGIALVVFASYIKILSGFFQQDEWLSFSLRYLQGGLSILDFLKTAFAPSVGHFQPLNTLALQTLFSFFKLSYPPYAFVSITLHLVNVLLVYYLCRTIFLDKKAAAVAALIFGVSASVYQATSWVMADLGIHLSSIFAFLSLIFIFKFIRQQQASLIQKRSKELFFLSVFCLVISLLFKEIALGLFLLIPLSYFLFSNQGRKEKLKYTLIILCVGAAYLIFRLAMVFLPQAYTHDEVITQSQPPSLIAYNVVTFPFKGLVQSIVPADILVSLSSLVTDNFLEEIAPAKNTPEYDMFVQKRVLEVVSFTIFLIFLFLAVVSWKKSRQSIWAKCVIFSFLFILLNTPVFALAPERIGKVFIIDSRNLYFVSFGTAVLIVSLLNLLSSKLNYKLGILTVLVLGNIYLLSQKLSDVVNPGIIRKDILSKIKNEHQALPKKVVFYTESDSSFYGLSAEERILPFQSGFGQSLLIWYHPQENFPKSFLENKFLWEITSQGYKEAGDRGYGYFRDWEQLTKALAENGLAFSSVIAYRYDSTQKTVFNISEEVKGRLEGYAAKKLMINPARFSLKSGYNQRDLVFALDNKRETKWSATYPYETSQAVEIQFDTFHEIARIDIDTYNNKDQNQVGFKVYVSDEGQDWQQIFYSRAYPPDKDGLIKIYLKPVSSRFLKIEQVGQHKYAPWVIHELQLYESLEKQS